MIDTDRLISLKENFTGQQFQWIKTNNPNLLAKVVKCRDIIPLEGGRFVAHFDDGSKIDTSMLNSSLLMIYGDNKPLSKEEVMAINGPKASLSATSKSAAKPETGVPPSSKIEAPKVTPIASPPVQPSAPKVNMFTMFNSEESTIALNVTLKLPEKKLLKMMYSNAEDKKKFMDELSEYVQSMINKEVVASAMLNILAPAVKPATKEEVIKIREIKE